MRSGCQTANPIFGRRRRRSARASLFRSILGRNRRFCIGCVCLQFLVVAGIHRLTPFQDDSIYHNVHTPIETWTEPRDLARDSSLSMFVAGTESTAENGATRLIPGSHLWGHGEEPEDIGAVHAELEPSDALFMLSSVYHGGSANTGSNKTRIVFASSIIRGSKTHRLQQFERLFADDGSPSSRRKPVPHRSQRDDEDLSQRCPEVRWLPPGVS